MADHKQTISFAVDAGLINRLGRELVGKPETALSELVKNCYDADATVVKVQFFDSESIGGMLIISDDGLGMTQEELRKGFMTISSTDKIHNPTSKRFGRSRAGRKGIGRFATQMLGEKLTIITQTLNEDNAIKLEVDWGKYTIDQPLSGIQNSFEYIKKEQPEGTILVIEGLREVWTETSITRVSRYVAELLQPDYLSDRGITSLIAIQNEGAFTVSFSKITQGSWKNIASPDQMVLDKALAVIEGRVDDNGNGFCRVSSKSLDVPTEWISVPNIKSSDGLINPNGKFNILPQVNFKAYYFIYNREKYYYSINKQELKSVQALSQTQGGIRLYRNGFRVLPYGEPNDDWLNIDRRYYNESGTNAPFGNRNLFGFVEILDRTGQLFEETASREGLIENDAYRELATFLHLALETARQRLRYAVEQKKKDTGGKTTSLTIPLEAERTTIEKIEALEKNVQYLFDNSKIQDDFSDEANTFRKDTKKIVEDLKTDLLALLDEVGMLRVLAGLGLTISEFTHEVTQFSPSIMGDLSVISEQQVDAKGLRSIENLRRTIQLFMAYTSYFNATVSANVSRELKPQNLEQVANNFKQIIDPDISKQGLSFEIEPYGYDLITLPMHASEWSSILFNLYTNAKKAIRRHAVPGKIKVVIGKEESNKVYLEFLDNGDGVPEENKIRIFDAFFTTSAPLGFDSTEDEKLTGTGLGLKIVKDIVLTYGGTIQLVNPENSFSTCFRIELPIVNEKQKQQYGL